MKKVYSNELLPMAACMQTLLENNEISCFIKNQGLPSVMGEIPHHECWPEVWVHDDADYAQAMTVIHSVSHVQAENQADWFCECGEANTAEFFSCWNCGGERHVIVE